MKPLSDERDGNGFVDWITSDPKALEKWLLNLCEAERQGAIKFAALLKQVSGSPEFPSWLVPEIRRMQRQEAAHYALVKSVLAVRGLEEVRKNPKPETMPQMFLSERRAVMRFTTMLQRDRDLPGDIYEIAHTILPDEAYHVVICEELMKDWSHLKV